jgi:hypothetical protein
MTSGLERELIASPSDTMDKWDEEKLRNVVTSKAGNPRTSTDVSRSMSTAGEYRLTKVGF